MYRLVGDRLPACATSGVPLRGDFTLDADAVLAAIGRDRPALTWIAYPNNPTGNLFPREAILRIVAAAPGLVVIDEAYYAFSGGATLLGEVGRHPNLVLVRTVSKLGLAGLRLGLAIAPARAGPRELEKLRLPYNVNVLSTAAAELLLDHGDVLRRADRGDRGRARAPGERCSTASLPWRVSRARPTSCWCAYPMRRAPSRACGSVVYWFATSTARIRCSTTA